MDDRIDYSKIERVKIEASGDTGQFELVIDGTRLRGKLSISGVGVQSFITRGVAMDEREVSLSFRLENAVVTKE